MALFAIAPTLFGGNVITDNLPAGTAIVNVDGTQDGALGYNGDQSLWYRPFYAGLATNFLEYTVQPGTYSFRIVDPADAAALFPSLTQTQTNHIFTAWSFNSPWVTDYLVFDSAAETNTALAQLFDGACINSAFYLTATDAYNTAISNGSYALIRTAPEGRDSNVFTNSYTFTNVETLVFAVPDYYLGDNGGGVSVVIAPIISAAPLLTINPAGADTVMLLWPTNALGYGLEQDIALTGSGWDAVTNTRVVSGTNYSVTLSVNPTNRFFRLHHP
jgi:hypothetical protein